MRNLTTLFSNAMCTIFRTKPPDQRPKPCMLYDFSYTTARISSSIAAIAYERSSNWSINSQFGMNYDRTNFTYMPIHITRRVPRNCANTRLIAQDRLIRPASPLPVTIATGIQRSGEAFSKRTGHRPLRQGPVPLAYASSNLTGPINPDGYDLPS